MADKKKHSILIVDDEAEILFSLRGLLRTEFQVYTAESGIEALAILHSTPIHVIMTDQRMPQMTGSELLRRASQEAPDAVRIVFTGYADIKAVVDSINEGGIYRYLTKPWDPDELVEVLREAASRYELIMERHRLLTELQSHLTHERSLLHAWCERARETLGTSEQALAETQAVSARDLLDRLLRVLPAHPPSDE